MFQKSVPGLRVCSVHAAPLVRCSALLLLLGWRVWAQDGADIANAPPPMPQSGPQIRNISAYTVYYSNGAPATGSFFQPASSHVSPDVGLGGSAVLAWTKFTDRSTFS